MGWVEIFQFLLGWVHYSKSNKNSKGYVNPSHCSPSFLLLKYLLRGFPGLFTVISEHICFLRLLSFLFLHFLVVGSVR